MELTLGQVDQLLTAFPHSIAISTPREALFTTGKIYGVYYPGTHHRVWFNADGLYPLEKQKSLQKEMGSDWIKPALMIYGYSALYVKVLSQNKKSDENHITIVATNPVKAHNR